MNIYIERYNKFITSIKRNSIEKNQKYETHHIIPRCLGGSDNPENLLKMTPRQHFIAHWMLWKCYPETGLCHAFFMMCNKKNQRINSKTYQLLKLEHSSKMNIMMKTKNPMWGLKDEQKKIRNEKISKSTLGVKKSKEFCEKNRIRQNLPENKKIKSDQAKKYLKNKDNYDKRIEQLSSIRTPNHYENMSILFKRYRWYTNGIKTIRCFPENIPDGFYPGRLKK